MVDAVIIRQGELVGRHLMAYETTEALGSVDYLLVDVKRSHAVGLSYTPPGLLARKQSLSWTQLVKIGRDSIVVQTNTAPEAQENSPLAAAQNMTGLEVWTDGGDHIGRVMDLCVNVETGEVQQYLFALNQTPPEPGSREGSHTLNDEAAGEIDEATGKIDEATVTVYAIAPQAIISAGRKRMMIAEEDAQRARPYDQPLPLTPITSTAEKRINWKPEQRPEMPNDLGELLQKGQSFAGKVTEQVKQKAQKFTDERLAQQHFVDADTLPDISEQLQEKTAQVKQQMQQQLQKAREKAQEQIDSGLGQNVSDQLENTALGRSLGKTLGRFRKPQAPEEPIDVEAFEVWEDD
ncbi:MAG: hypothetical protein AAFV90_14230 [Cyanobacteria bacterium J06634_5]